MDAALVSGIVFGCVVCGAVLGMVLNIKLPDHHLDGDSKDVVKLVMGLIATMAALVLSLLIASAKTTYDTQETEIQHLAANIVQLDRILVHYGPETEDARALLRQTVAIVIQRIWPKAGTANLEPLPARGGADAFYDQIQDLSPKTNPQRYLQSQALQITEGLAETRLLMLEQLDSSLSLPFLLILVFWLAILFLGFGLFARLNVTVMTALLVGALSVSGALFLILELNQPYRGVMQISGFPLHNALTQISR